MLVSRTIPRACAEQGVEQTPPHVRRQRYAGRYPRSFAEKHKERAGDAVTVGKIEAKGNTAVGTHRPICVAEIINALNPEPGHTGPHADPADVEKSTDSAGGPPIARTQ